MPGKSYLARLPEDFSPTRYPSMRPRHECRGRDVTRTLVSTRRRAFNEAPARMPGKRSRSSLDDPRIEPSMRPRHECRGREDRAPASVQQPCCPSMRPRHECRGRACCWNRRRPKHCADPSMRPRHECRGRGAIPRAARALSPVPSMRPRHECRGRDRRHLCKPRQRVPDQPASAPNLQPIPTKQRAYTVTRTQNNPLIQHVKELREHCRDPRRHPSARSASAH